MRSVERAPWGRSVERALTVRACAKINVTLRVMGVRPDGYHELRSVFQSLALHDTLAFVRARGAFRIECDDPACPTDRTNLVWRAAERVWRAAGRKGEPRDVTVRLAKRIPLQSGLGGGSSDAAAAIRGLSLFWRAALPHDRQRDIASSLGADVPFFLEGGTALGVDRGDRLFPLVDLAPRWVTLVIPSFGVSTKEAYGWFDAKKGRASPPRTPGTPRRQPLGDLGALGGSVRRFLALPADEFRNDLEAAVAARHPEIVQIVRALGRQGAEYAAMSGSGSAVFGLFASKPRADRAARALAGRALGGRAPRAIVTRTVGRAAYAGISLPR